jgi:hypothetical protein
VNVPCIFLAAELTIRPEEYGSSVINGRKKYRRYAVAVTKFK